MWVSGKFLLIAIAIWVELSDIQSQLLLWVVLQGMHY